MSLAEVIQPEPVEAGLYRGAAQPTPTLRLFGGLVLAQAVVAAGRAMPPDRQVHSIQARFVRAGDSQRPVDYEVDVISAGRAFAVAQVTARQSGRILFVATVSAQRPGDPGPSHQDPKPEIADPRRLPSGVPLMVRMSPRDPEIYLRRFAGLDLRYVDDGARTRAGVPMPRQWWWRAETELPADPLVHQALLAYLTDFTVLGSTLRPHRLGFEDPLLQTASLDHVIWFHRPVRLDGWLLCDQASPSASGGRGLGTARVFTEDGLLVASVAQEGLLRYVS
ncbi:acyl-CoA thioesterase [Dactylosporangium sp. CA-092794]|uniref:acyl-CoA thioesterase n=1 Tax=Dactylosporangium sp. CA-092794 TaxID=3239929 RepID=UPI003D8C49D7